MVAGIIIRTTAMLKLHCQNSFAEPFILVGPQWSAYGGSMADCHGWQGIFFNCKSISSQGQGFFSLALTLALVTPPPLPTPQMVVIGVVLVVIEVVSKRRTTTTTITTTTTTNTADTTTKHTIKLITTNLSYHPYSSRHHYH